MLMYVHLHELYSSVGTQIPYATTPPDEMSLSEMEFWQAYRNWLMCIDLIADSVMANGWHEHHTHMMADKSFSVMVPSLEGTRLLASGQVHDQSVYGQSQPFFLYASV